MVKKKLVNQTVYFIYKHKLTAPFPRHTLFINAGHLLTHLVYIHYCQEMDINNQLNLFSIKGLPLDYKEVIWRCGSHFKMIWLLPLCFTDHLPTALEDHSNVIL